MWYLVQLTEEAAEAHDRRVHNCGPDVMLGWKPYTYRATFQAVSQFACHTEAELKSRLAANDLRIVGWGDWHDGLRITKLERGLT